MKDTKRYFRQLMIISVPILLSNVISQIQMIVDRIFLGRMETLYMSALSNVDTSVWTTMSFCFALSTGASILISQNVGAGDAKNTKYYSAALLKWNNVIPFILFFFWEFAGEYVFKLMGVSDAVMPMCLEYVRFFSPVFLILGFESSFSVIMQTSNYTTPLVFYGIIRSGLNVFLDWVMIFGNLGCPRMGIKGGAIATAIAEFAGCLFASFALFNKNLITKPSFIDTIKAPIKPFLQSIKLGINVALEDLSWNFGNIVLIRVLNSINDLAAGIYSIVFNAEVLVVVVMGAVGQGTLTLSGEAKGSGDKKQYVTVCKLAYIISAVVSAILLVVSIIIPEKIIGIFTKDEYIITSSGIYLILMCCNMFSKAANIIVGNSIRGSGNTKWMFGTQIFGTVFVIACACLFVFGIKLGILGVFIAVLLDEFVRAVINFAYFRRIVRKWDEKVVSENE